MGKYTLDKLLETITGYTIAALAFLAIFYIWEDNVETLSIIRKFIFTDVVILVLLIIIYISDPDR